MKRFDIITEIEARSLAPGETVELSRRGHITPLAQDTLTARRVTVVREGRVSDADAIAGAGRRDPDARDGQRPYRCGAAADA